MKLRWHGSNHAGLVPYIYTDNNSIVQSNYLFVIGDRDGNQFDTSEYCAALPTLDIILTVIDCLRWWESPLKGQLTAEVIKIVVDSPPDQWVHPHRCPEELRLRGTWPSCR